VAFYQALMANLRVAIAEGRLDALRREMRERSAHAA
jgi:hypothetical protein